jgi:hypothetical protein
MTGSVNSRNVSGGTIGFTMADAVGPIQTVEDVKIEDVHDR